MLNKYNIEYPAYIYQKKGVFIADCVIFNLSAFGKTEKKALDNLQKSISQALMGYNISIRSVYSKNYRIK